MTSPFMRTSLMDGPSDETVNKVVNPLSLVPCPFNDGPQLCTLNKSGQVLITRERDGREESHFSPSLRQLCRSESCFVSQSFASPPRRRPPSCASRGRRDYHPSEQANNGHQTNFFSSIHGGHSVLYLTVLSIFRCLP